MRRQLTALGGMLLAAMLGVGCSSGEAPAAVKGASIERTTTSSAPSASTTEGTVELLPPSHITRDEIEATAADWEGQQYDFGIIRRVSQTDGRWRLTFDREQIRDAHGVRDGPTLAIEPVLIGDPPGVQIVNTSPKLRTFAVRPDVEILRLAPSWTCENNLASWVPLSIEQLAATPELGGGQDALTFDSAGQVVRIRLSRGC